MGTERRRTNLCFPVDSRCFFFFFFFFLIVALPLVLCVVVPNCSPPNPIASGLGVAPALYGVPGQAGLQLIKLPAMEEDEVWRYCGGSCTAPPAGSWTT
jgi:hypothetical protein